MKVLCVSYRQWALDIYETLQAQTDHEILIIRSKEEFSQEIIENFQPDYILFYGWSWIISEEILEQHKCVMLHPSSLPKYRGGSPIQNQIIAGEIKSAVTLFFMTNELDAGDIILQEEISLKGHLHEILNRITKVGAKLSIKFLAGDFTPKKQNEDEATYCKRRTPQQSEITLEELTTQSSTYLFNKIRMLEDPYPNAYIKTIDGKKLLLKMVEVSDE